MDIMVKYNPLLPRDVVHEHLVGALPTYKVSPKYAKYKYGAGPTELIEATIDYTSTILEMPTIPMLDQVFASEFLPK